MKSEDELIALQDEVLEQVTGGMSEDEFQHLEVGARVRVIAGIWENHTGTVTGFVDDSMKPGVRLVALTQLDSGEKDAFGSDEIVRE